MQANIIRISAEQCIQFTGDSKVEAVFVSCLYVPCAKKRYHVLEIELLSFPASA